MQYSIVCWSCVSSFVLFSLFVVCVWLWCGFWTINYYGQFWGSISFFIFIGFFIFVFSPSSSADVKGLLGTFPRCDHIDRVQVKGHGSSTFKTLRPSQGSGTGGSPGGYI